MKRLLLTSLCCLAVLALTWQPARAVEAELGIGSDAPSLDVEHWIQNGNGFFKPVDEFKKDQVYVVEFWATWCGPCVASMPHLAEIQQKYRGRGVQVVSITDEPLDTVEPFLERRNDELQKSFAEITSAYCLTSDPDGSSHVAYMEAANQEGIPAAFIVGKSGIIEWIGHPMEIDGPLEAVVEGSWDREAFKEELERMQAMQQFAQQTMQEISQLVGTGKADSAIQLIKTRIEEAQYPELTENLRDLLFQVKLGTGRRDAETVAYYRGQLERAKGNARQIAEFGGMMFGAIQQGVDPGPLVQDSIDAINTELETADQQFKPMLFVSLAQLYVGTERLDASIAALEKGVEAAEGSQRERLSQMLEQLRAEIARSQTAPAEK